MFLKKIVVFLTLFCFVAADTRPQRKICKEKPQDPSCRKFNILSLQSAENFGFMTAKFVEFLEKTAYYQAKEMYCIERKNEKIAMPELFDIIAGTETGAIIAGSLVIPGENTSEDDFVAMYAHNSKEFYRHQSKNLFVSQELSFWWNILISAVFASLLSVLTFACLRKYFKIDVRKVKHLSEVQLMIHFQTEIASGAMQHEENEKLQKKLSRLEELQA